MLGARYRDPLTGLGSSGRRLLSFSPLHGTGHLILFWNALTGLKVGCDKLIGVGACGVTATGL